MTLGRQDPKGTLAIEKERGLLAVGLASLLEKRRGVPCRGENTRGTLILEGELSTGTSFPNREGLLLGEMKLNGRRCTNL